MSNPVPGSRRVPLSDIYPVFSFLLLSRHPRSAAFFAREREKGEASTLDVVGRGGETPPVTRGSGGEEKEKGGREGRRQAALLAFIPRGGEGGRAFSLRSMRKSCLRVSSVKIGVKINP